MLLLWDLISVFASIQLGFKLRFGFAGDIPSMFYNEIPFYVIAIFSVLVIVNIIFRNYSNVLSRVGYIDILRMLLTTAIVAVSVVIGYFAFQLTIPIEVILIVFIILFPFLIISRLSVRVFLWLKNKMNKLFYSGNMKRVLIYGAGEAGTYLIKKIHNNPQKELTVIGFVDDTKELWGKKVSGVEVLGNGEILGELIQEYNINEIIIAIPTASRELLRMIVDTGKEFNCNVKRYGSIDDVTEGDFNKAQINNINLEDLLRRNSVMLDMDSVLHFLKDKTVLVTGGVGSIGSEICRQVLKFGAKKVILFDINENGLFDIDNELKETYERERYELKLGSIRDKKRLKEVVKQYKPEIIFHAAAHKHVPMMEENPKEAIKNNVFGTINVCNIAAFSKVEKFILISTDKAVNPTNIMGASKRIAELVIQLMDKVSDTEFAAVRFGNVLGSNGSVVPFFKKQIESGGPVTVTDPKMRRYFMTIPEAVQLVLQAGDMANGGEIFVLDMGEPVLIYDLACDLIKLSGFEPHRDIKIEFTGLRPGEKLFEEMSLEDEDTSKTKNDKIFINKPIENDEKKLACNIKLLEDSLKLEKPVEMFKIVSEIVDTFDHKKYNKED
jgi:FlaA1/EpsC-like NDP-sugar epimerase